MKLTGHDYEDTNDLFSVLGLYGQEALQRSDDVTDFALDVIRRLRKGMEVEGIDDGEIGHMADLIHDSLRELAQAESDIARQVRLIIASIKLYFEGPIRDARARRSEIGGIQVS